MNRICTLFLCTIFAGCSGPSSDSVQTLGDLPIIKPNDPESVRRWEASSLNVFNARIEIRTLRLLHGSLKSEQKQSAVTAIQVANGRSAGTSGEQLAAIEQLMANEEAIFDAVRRAVYDHYKQMYPAWKEGLDLGAAMFGGANDVDEILPTLTDGNELDALVKFDTVFIHPASDVGCTIGIEFSVPWDEENGLGLRLKGSEVLSIGTAHEAYPDFNPK